jgi:hypothetical protein
LLEAKAITLATNPVVLVVSSWYTRSHGEIPEMHEYTQKTNVEWSKCIQPHPWNGGFYKPLDSGDQARDETYIML